MEMDPGTFDLPRLQAFLQECGVTRVSMGVQAFDAGLLAACGRAHRYVRIEMWAAPLWQEQYIRMCSVQTPQQTRHVTSKTASRTCTPPSPPSRRRASITTVST